MAAMTGLGHALMRGVALSLGLDESYFAGHYTGDPLILFRIFNYPAQPAATGCGRDRLSFPFFFDPNFNAEVEPLPLDSKLVDDRDERWDKASVREFRGTYGDYLLDKVSKVFPQLRRDVL
jgi:isopenicillin N synthase-like dioxygenase